jgi:hypothetical protein
MGSGIRQTIVDIHSNKYELIIQGRVKESISYKSVNTPIL